jgi:hypothetical protein
MLARLTSDGEPDPAFDGGADGLVTLDPGLGGEVGSAVALAPDGSIALAGTSTFGSDPPKQLIARFRGSAPAVARQAVLVSRAGSGAGTVTGSGFSCGTDCDELVAPGTSVTFTATPAAGSSFDGWSGCDSLSGGRCTVAANFDRTVQAIFSRPPQRILDVTPNQFGFGTVSGAGIDCGADCQESYDKGSTVVLTAVAITGYVLSGWTGCDSVAGNRCTVTMASSRVVTPTFGPDTSTRRVTVIVGGGAGGQVVGPGGFECPPGCSHDYLAGATVRLEPVAGPAGLFDTWQGCDALEGSRCVLTVSSARTVTAMFRRPMLKIFKLGPGSIQSAPAGIDCGPVCAASFPLGLPVRLVATPDAGAGFIGWSLPGCAGTGPCNVDFTDDTTVTGTFALLGAGAPGGSAGSGGGGSGSGAGGPGGAGGAGGAGGGGAASGGAPDTRFTSSRPRGRRPRVAFAGVGGTAPLRFFCAFDRKAFKPCASPLRLRRLRKGRHTLRVRAVDAAGRVDQTPASVKFRLRRRV